MERLKERILTKNSFSIVVLLLISALFYLPLINKFGYTHDDWYLMYAAKVKGASIFYAIFAGDRPLRAFLMIPAYWFFGENSLYYNLASYFFRLLGAFSFLWSLRLMWASEKKMMFFTALFFLVYPGFLSSPNGIDYLSHQVALAFASLSIALSLKAVLTQKRWRKLTFYFLSILLGNIYLGLMEYYIGIEALRFLLLLLLFWREENHWVTKIKRSITQSIPFLLTFLPFLWWRLFIFQSERGATDTEKQFSTFLVNPIRNFLSWGIELFRGFLKTLFGAWTIPFSQFYTSSLGVNINIAIKAIFLFITFWGFYMLLFKKGEKKSWQQEVFFLSTIALFFSLAPIILVNRQVGFPHYSRYTLPGSFSASMLLVLFIFMIRSKYIRGIFIAILIIIAGATHHANAQKFATETASMNAFWWQVSWRIPHLGERTTLVVNYPLVSTEEDYFIWGPANQIYYPKGTSEKVVQPGIYAFILNDETIGKIIARERQEYSNRRGIESYPNARNILILSQPTLGSCVHVIDGFAPEYSSFEKADIMKIGEFSEVEHILTDAESHHPPEVIFGPEPEHGWCYIYQKATLARQKSDWEGIWLLDRQASRNEVAPQDAVEWMPFLQASAVLGDRNRVREIQSFIQKDAFVVQQACEILTKMELTPEMHNLTKELYCPMQ